MPFKKYLVTGYDEILCLCLYSRYCWTEPLTSRKKNKFVVLQNIFNLPTKLLNKLCMQFLSKYSV